MDKLFLRKSLFWPQIGGAVSVPNFSLRKYFTRQRETLISLSFPQRNEHGRSRPSEVATLSTQGSAPPAPQPPGLQEATKASLHLAWAKRVCDEEFVLQMDDRFSGHGFLTCYNGSSTTYLSTGLRRNTAYK